MENEHLKEVKIPEYVNDSHAIIVTHFINPHLFWYRYQTRYHHFENLIQITKDIENYVTSVDLVREYPDGYVPKLKEIVLVKHFASYKYIRGIIDRMADSELDEEADYTIWCMDYGVPMFSKSRWMLPISEKLAKQECLVYFGGIANVLPAEKQHNLLNGSNELVTAKSWSDFSLKHFDMEILGAAYVNFMPQYIIGNHYYGQMTIRRNASIDHTYNIMEKLFRMDQAVKSDNFLNDIKLCDSIEIKRWQNNKKNPVALCLSTINTVSVACGQSNTEEECSGATAANDVAVAAAATAAATAAVTGINAKIHEWLHRNDARAAAAAAAGNDTVDEMASDAPLIDIDSTSDSYSIDVFPPETNNKNRKTVKFAGEKFINNPIDPIILSNLVKITPKNYFKYVVEGNMIGLPITADDDTQDQFDVEFMENQWIDNHVDNHENATASGFPDICQNTESINVTSCAKDDPVKQVEKQSLTERMASITTPLFIQIPDINYTHPNHHPNLYPADLNRAVADEYYRNYLKRSRK